jgi:hypothetical protein
MVRSAEGFAACLSVKGRINLQVDARRISRFSSMHLTSAQFLPHSLAIDPNGCENAEGSRIKQPRVDLKS